jgi:pyruvyl transferase EpsI
VTFTAIRDLAAACTTEDIITIVGGGNMCDLYASIEDARRFVVGRFPRNRIISFPQTMDFSDTARGRRELRKSQRAYGRHRHLRLFAREALSLERMRAAFPDTDVQLVPDIVLSVDASASEGIRRGTLLCIRNDYESVIPESVRRNLVLELSRTLEDVSVTDTVLAWERRLSREEREAELDAVLRRFRAAEVVVTDRLHGMIFAAITKTPCVALRNSNHKIAATHRESLVFPKRSRESGRCQQARGACPVWRNRSCPSSKP